MVINLDELDIKNIVLSVLTDLKLISAADLEKVTYRDQVIKDAMINVLSAKLDISVPIN
jgi:flagellar basal body-associated protein FliL